MNSTHKKVNYRFITASLGALIAVSAIILVPVHTLAQEDDPTSGLDVPCLIVVDQNDPTAVIYEKNADQRCIPGSTMKIMTCILSLELCKDLNQPVTVTAQAVALKDSNSLMGMIKGETLTVHQLLYGLMLESGNDAALLLAQALGGSVEEFVTLMNEKAASLGMLNTHFTNSSGAYKRDQYSTPRDMATLTCYALQNETFREIVSTVSYTIEPNGVRTRAMTMFNSNKLISDPADSRLFYEYATGVKTGSTAQGGKCLVASASKNGAGVVAVLLGVKDGGSKIERMTQVYEDAKYILDLALTEQFVSVSPADLGLDQNISLPLYGAEETTISLSPSFADNAIMLTRVQFELLTQNPANIVTEISVPLLSAPVVKDEVCAEAIYRIGDRSLFTADLTAQASAEAIDTSLSIATVATPALTPVADNSEASISLQQSNWLLPAITVFLAAIAILLVLLLAKSKK